MVEGGKLRKREREKESRRPKFGEARWLPALVCPRKRLDGKGVMLGVEVWRGDSTTGGGGSH